MDCTELLEEHGPHGTARYPQAFVSVKRYFGTSLKECASGTLFELLHVLLSLVHQRGCATRGLVLLQEVRDSSLNAARLAYL